MERFDVIIGFTVIFNEIFKCFVRIYIVYFIVNKTILKLFSKIFQCLKLRNSPKINADLIS